MIYLFRNSRCLLTAVESSSVYKFWLLISAALMLNACSSSVTVDSRFPSPLVSTLPVSAGLYYSDTFANYQYQEKSKDRTDWTIEFGNAQSELLTTVFNRLFSSTQIIRQMPSATTPTQQSQLIFVPTLKDFQYSVPTETKVNIFEVWIKYQMQVYNARGELVADWIVTAYGKTPTAFLRSEEEALEQAIIVALRDWGASLSLGIPKVPELAPWLQ